MMSEPIENIEELKPPCHRRPTMSEPKPDYTTGPNYADGPQYTIGPIQQAIGKMGELPEKPTGEKFLASDGNCYGIDDFNAIHASPPCQAFSTMTNGRWQDRVSEHPKLIEPIRRLLIASGKPYVIENVEGARGELINPILLCGTMFKLETEAGNQLRRHRYFECSFGYLWTPPCQHNSASAIGVYGGGQNPARRKRRYKAEGENTDFGIVARSFVMGVDWMTGKELNESIPPAYTEFMGRQLAEYLRAQ
jgi:DNA (cytosine-5)-methyltransferase 1